MNKNNNACISGWAKSVMTLGNLVFLVLDTTSLKGDIVRVLAVTLEGDELYHQIVKPVRYPDEPNTQYTGISQEQLDQAKTLAEQWEDITEALKGKYVISYGFDWVQERLDDAAQAYHLPPVFLVGDCLHHLASMYCHRSNGIKLPAALTYVGFPRLIGQNARSRASAQMVLLEAIADGHPKRQASPALPPVTVYDGLDDHPF